MSSRWADEIGAVMRKEILSEIRSPHGLVTGGLFSLLSVVAIYSATYNMDVTPTLAAGLFWVVLMLAATSSLPRTFLSEEELGTGDLLRMTANPFSVYWGKALFNFCQIAIQTAVLSVLFINLTSQHIQIGWLVWLSLAGGSMALSGAVTFCGALAARAANRYALSGAIALPLVMPIAFWGVAGLRVGLGEGFLEGGRAAGIGLLAYGIVSNAIGPFLYSSLWKS